MFYIGLYNGKYDKIFLSETTRTKALIFGILHHLVDHYQIYSNYAPGGQKWAQPGGHIGLYKNHFYIHVAYQIKGNEAYNYMLANVSPLHTSLTPWAEVGHVAYQLKGNDF